MGISLPVAVFRLAARTSNFTGGMDQAGTTFPAFAAFLELPAFGVFRMTGFALFAVAAVELQRHDFDARNWASSWHSLRAIARWTRILYVGY